MIFAEKFDGILSVSGAVGIVVTSDGALPLCDPLSGMCFILDLSRLLGISLGPGRSERS